MIIESVRASDSTRTAFLAVIDGASVTVPDDPLNSDRQRIKREWEDTGHVIENAPVPLPVVPETISDRQFFQQLAVQRIVTQDEALAAVRTGAIPAAMQALVDALPTHAQFPAEMQISGATVFERHHPLTVAIGQAYGWTDAQLDELWTAASGL